MSSPSAQAPSPFQYAMVRVVPRVERGECVNAGVVLFCRPRRFLAARIRLDEARVRALAPEADMAAILGHLDAFARVAAGDAAAGPIAALPASERFHWLVAPSSTVIQCSPGSSPAPPGSPCPSSSGRSSIPCWATPSPTRRSRS